MHLKGGQLANKGVLNLKDESKSLLLGDDILIVHFPK